MNCSKISHYTVNMKCSPHSHIPQHTSSMYVLLYLVSFQALLALDILEAELADVDDWLCCQLRWVGREVPWLHSVATQLNHFHILNSCDDILWSMSRSAAVGKATGDGGTRWER